MSRHSMLTCSLCFCINLGLCKRSGCRRPRVFSPRTGHLQEYCSIKCKNLDTTRPGNVSPLCCIFIHFLLRNPVQSNRITQYYLPPDTGKPELDGPVLDLFSSLRFNHITRLHYWSSAALDCPPSGTEPLRLPLLVSGTVYPSTSLLHRRCLSSGHASRLISSPFFIPVRYYVQCLCSDTCHFGHFNPFSVYPGTVSGSTMHSHSVYPVTVTLLQPAQHPLVDIVTYSASCFPVTVTNTEQMPKTVLIHALALVA